MPLTKVSSRAIEDTLRYVLGANGTSDYTFTGPGLSGAVNDPTLTLSRGHTYIFENRSGGHPFYIKTSIANGGTQDAYNTGVTNNGGGNGTEIIFTVPHDAPDLLYYQCSSHSSMAGQLKIVGAVADGSITTAKLAADAVTSDKIADDAVTAAKIADNSITAAQLAPDSVSYSELAVNAVGNENINSGAISSGKMASSSVATAAIQEQAVTLDKLPHGTSSNDGKFLRANNGADPTFETVSTDLVADTSPQLGGDLATNNHAINFGDSSGELNDRANFGDDKDLQIFYNGTNSYITNDTNDLLIQNTGDDIYIDAADDIFIRTSNNEDAIKCLGDGAVELYNNNTKRLETSSDGYYYYGTITGGTAARSNAGITQTNVLTPATRFFTGGYGTQDQNVTIQATTGNWQGGSSSTSHRSSGILFNRINNSVQQIRAGIQHDINGSEKFKIHCSYGDISFRTQSNAHGNKVWEDCDREPLILHHDGHVAMLHMPYAYWSPGGDSNTYQTDGTEHLIDGSSANTMRNGMSIDTSNGRITVPYSGVYQVNANIGLYRTTGSSRSRLNLMKNGTDVIRQEHANENANSDGGWKTFTLSHAIELGANDYISFDCVGKHDSGVYAVVTVVLLHGDAT